MEICFLDKISILGPIIFLHSELYLTKDKKLSENWIIYLSLKKKKLSITHGQGYCLKISMCRNFKLI